MKTYKVTMSSGCKHRVKLDENVWGILKEEIFKIRTLQTIDGKTLVCVHIESIAEVSNE